MIRFIYNLLWPLGLVPFSPALFRQNVPARWLPREIRTAPRNVRCRCAHAPGGAKIDMVARRKRGGSGGCAQAGEQLQLFQPDLRCVLTVTTTTGFSFANKEAPRWIEVMYTPLDFWPIMRRAFAVIRPARIILVEAEVWPNLAAEAHARGIPLALVNARLSPRSENRFRRFRFFVAPTFRLLDLVCVPEPEGHQSMGRARH